VRELPAIPVVTEGHGPSLPTLKLKDAADALLYLGPRNSLVTVQMSPAELEGTPYGKEIERGKDIQMKLEKSRSGDTSGFCEQNQMPIGYKSGEVSISPYSSVTVLRLEPVLISSPS